METGDTSAYADRTVAAFAPAQTAPVVSGR